MNVIPLADRIRETRANLAREHDFPEITDQDMDAAVVKLQLFQEFGISGRELRDKVIGFMHHCGYGDFNDLHAEILIPLLEGMAQVIEVAQVNK